MGKREQFIRVLMSAAYGLGFDSEREGNMEVQLSELEKRIRRKWHNLGSEGLLAWLCIYDTMQCMSPRNGAGDTPPAATVSTKCDETSPRHRW